MAGGVGGYNAVGGYAVATTEIYSMASLEWRSGPPMPEQLSFGASVPYGNTFLTVGGSRESDGRYSKNIYSYDPNRSNWIKVNKELKYPRSGFVAFTTPGSILACN